MGLSWQQGPLGRNPNGQFLVPDMPPRVLYAEPLRAGETAWFEVHGDTRDAARGAWQHVALPACASILAGKVALAWRAMDGFYEEDDRILGHAADLYHRIDIRHSTRHLVVRSGDRVIADTSSPLVLYESGFAPRWYVPRADVAEELAPSDLQTFCPYKGIASYYDIGETPNAERVLPSPARRHGGDRRSRLVRTRPRRGHAGRRAAGGRARADRGLARDRPRPDDR